MMCGLVGVLLVWWLAIHAVQAADKPLKVFILAGQSNMEGHAEVRTFDQIGKDPLTAPLLKEMRNPDGTPRVCDKVWMSYLIDSKQKNGPNADGKMTEEQKNKYLEEYRARLITPADQALWDSGASNLGYHYFGSAKTFAQIGKAFAEAMMTMQKKSQR